MRSLKVSLLLILMMLAAGCIPNQIVSIFPLYDDQTLFVEPNLVGSWAADEQETWTFVKSSGKSYHLFIADTKKDAGEEESDDDGGELEARLVQLSSSLFLDLYSEDAGLTGAPAHVFAKIKIEKNSLQIEWFDEDWMKDQLKQQTYVSSISTPGGKIVLTSATQELQYFYSNHAWDKGAVSNGKGPDSPKGDFHRIPSLPIRNSEHGLQSPTFADFDKK